MNAVLVLDGMAISLGESQEALDVNNSSYTVEHTKAMKNLPKHVTSL